MLKYAKRTTDYILLEYAQSPVFPNNFELIPTNTKFNKFNKFRIEKAILRNLIKQGIEFVCESWFNSNEISQIGLIQIYYKGYYLGEFIEPIKRKKEKGLMVFYIEPEFKTIKLCFFKNFGKKSIQSKLEFISDFINTINL